ncbi:hypothetical protein B0J11DRAFT_539754 [Dendryphion nanum]|uniref:Short-chain dehydrogenase/reductase n=1 Tax=Dendryphion nanum TaxID=256645 RepID=A0A9P9DA23_9PLEO|nr:hypothetical protein B0J11DRAFT_539754 [Dendryphion nanum]
MSEVTPTLHRKSYDAISASSPSQSQSERNVLITGSSDGIGKEVARAYVTAGAKTVVITSRSQEKADRTVAELQQDAKEGTKVVGYQFELNEEKSVQALWDNLHNASIGIDVLVLCATESLPGVQIFTPSILKSFSAFESNVKHQLLSVDRFLKQGADEGKVLLNFSSNAVHFNELDPTFAPSTASRLALARLLQDYSAYNPVEKLQILNIHPGFVYTDTVGRHGMSRDMFPFDDISLPANFLVWAATKQAAFLHGRFVWTTWDVEELAALKPKIEEDKGFLKVGLQGVKSQDFPLLIAGMQRAV